jgi:hypothetical protein
MTRPEDLFCAGFLIVLTLFPDRRLPFILGYCVLDMLGRPGMKRDMVLHHLLTAGLTYGTMIHPVEPRMIDVLVATEASTPFLVLKNMGCRHWLVYVSFVATFFYFRVWAFGGLVGHLLFTPRPEIPILLRGTACALYALNLWWWIKILSSVAAAAAKKKSWLRITSR